MYSRTTTLSGLQRSVRRASIFLQLCNTPVSISGQGGVKGYVGLVKDQSHAALGATLAAEVSPRGRLSIQEADQSTTSTLGDTLESWFHPQASEFCKKVPLGILFGFLQLKLCSSPLSCHPLTELGSNITPLTLSLESS